MGSKSRGINFDMGIPETMDAETLANELFKGEDYCLAYKVYHMEVKRNMDNKNYEKKISELGMKNQLLSDQVNAIASKIGLGKSIINEIHSTQTVVIPPSKVDAGCLKLDNDKKGG